MMALVDGDLYLYRTLAATEDETDWGDDVWSLTSDLKVAKKNFDTLIKRYVEECGVDWFVLCFSDKQNFRKELYPEYKSARRKIRKPVGYSYMIEWCRDNYETRTMPKLEADDVMGIKSNTTTIIISDDKDMKTIPTKLYRPQSNEFLDITQQEADKNFLTQALTGDSTDGYKGLSGVGIKKAEAILGSRPHWGAVEDAYVKAGYTKEEALTQARLARILRKQDWDYEKKEVKLWTP